MRHELKARRNSEGERLDERKWRFFANDWDEAETSKSLNCQKLN